MHNASQVLLGSLGSSDRMVTVEPADPATYVAGLAVRRKSDGGLSTVLADGKLVGVSRGKDLSETKKTAVVRTGNDVPLKVAPYLVKGSLTFHSKVDGAVTIAFITGGTAGSEVVTVVGNAISVSMEDGVSTATQMKAALDGSAAALALIETAITSGQGATAQAAFAVDDIDVVDHAAIGAVVEVSNVSGRAVKSGKGSVTGAFYASAALDALDATTGLVSGKAAKIDMAGGL